MAKLSDLEARRQWAEFIDSIRRETPVENLSHSEIVSKRKHLEAHPLEWIQYFFPKYAKYPFADFHKKAIGRILGHDEWYEVLSWSRELAKSTVVMFCVMYLTLTRRKRNVMLASSTQDAAIRLLAPYRANLEANGRIREFYGEQVNLGNWTDKEFITKGGAAFRAIGAGNAPRGSRNDEVRPDILLVDDFDTDEECRNPDIIEKKWQWYEQAFYATRSISEPTLVLWCGNLIAKDCCVLRASRYANHHDIVNIRDKDGHSTWPEKNTEEHIDETLSKISTASQQKEYYNNPVSEGEVFRDLYWGRIPPLSRFKFLVAYGDPAPGEKGKKGSSTKGVCLAGLAGGNLYVIKCFLDHALNADFIRWYFELQSFVGEKTPVFYYIENNSMQDPFLDQVFRPLVREECRKRGCMLSIRGDEQRKTDKATRIEANLEPLNRNGKLIFNQDEMDNPHMKRLTEQFTLFTQTLKYPADGPDMVEGAYRIIRNRTREEEPGLTLPRTKSSKKL
jgi:hypothetical protein